MFKGFERLSGFDVDNVSKSESERVYQYTRWKTWKYFNEQPKETIIINPEDSESDRARGTASVNGVTFYIIKGVYVEVPKDIAKLIRESQGQTAAIGTAELVSGIGRKIDPVTGSAKDPARLER